ncbi:MAG TPA: hypothetical protein VFE09_07670 [Rubrobacteraceae bacterium]|nr:hypothetical protein [Rubrobacteraceae bacterium]
MPEAKGMIISLALLQIEVVFLLILVVVLVIAGLLFVGVFISAVRRDLNRPGGGEGRERQERESEERDRSDRS